MTVGQLKDILEDVDDDLEVRIMSQQSYPFENTVTDVKLASEIDTDSDDADLDDVDGHVSEHYQPKPCRHGRDAPSDALYIVEGSQIGYGTKKAWQVC